MPGNFKPGTQSPRAAADGNAPSSGPDYDRAGLRLY
jgi:hypothetical protein